MQRISPVGNRWTTKFQWKRLIGLCDYFSNIYSSAIPLQSNAGDSLSVSPMNAGNRGSPSCSTTYSKFTSAAQAFSSIVIPGWSLPQIKQFNFLQALTVRPNLELIPGFKFVPIGTLFLIRLVVLEKRSCETLSNDARQHLSFWKAGQPVLLVHR